jgi:hypothetical protein
VEYERESIHYGDDPLPLRIQFPAQATITDLQVAFAENDTGYFAYRRGLSTWMLWHISSAQ